MPETKADQPHQDYDKSSQQKNPHEGPEMQAAVGDVRHDQGLKLEQDQDKWIASTSNEQSNHLHAVDSVSDEFEGD